MSHKIPWPRVCLNRTTAQRMCPHKMQSTFSKSKNFISITFLSPLFADYITDDDSNDCENVAVHFLFVCLTYAQFSVALSITFSVAELLSLSFERV